MTEYEVRHRQDNGKWSNWVPWIAAAGANKPLRKVIDWGYTVTLEDSGGEYPVTMQYRRVKDGETRKAA